MSEIVDLLKRVKERIHDPQNWCTDHLHIHISDKHQWCVRGALLEETGWFFEEDDEGKRRLYRIADSLLNDQGHLWLMKNHHVEEIGLCNNHIQVNNVHGHSAVMELLDMAIDAADEED